MQHKALLLMYYRPIKRKGAQGMKVSVDISPEHTEPYAVIYTSQMTDEIQRLLEVFGNSESPITALLNEEDLIILQPKDIYMVRVENGDTIIYGEQKKYRSRKRLYELGQQLGKQFMQISKSTLINLSYMDSIVPGFSGTLLLKLRNGCKEYVSRTYLPAFKKYLGL
jgi:DNA-binding LytR/AlgR family response regulator